jgi:transcriptional regulator with XRE-family HTH domain
MSAAAENYEDTVLGLKPGKEPKSIVEMVELKMFEKKMNQAKLAEELGLAKSKVSEILSGKRKPDLPFLKGLYLVFKIDPEFLLEHA